VSDAPATPSTEPTEPDERAASSSGWRDRSRRTGGLLAGMRIRKKLMFLHTVFSLGLAAILLVAMRPAIAEVVREAELAEARIVLETLFARAAGNDGREIVSSMRRREHIDLGVGSAKELELHPADARAARRASPSPVAQRASRGRGAALMALTTSEGTIFYRAEVRNPDARRAVWRLYALLIVALLAVYGLVALALEVFVLPQHVYGPIRRMLHAEQAVREGRPDEELIPEQAIPADELGEIMRSRNESIKQLRSHERALAEAFDRIEQVATDLKKKNHLLERARQNLADADRLASLGMMSAGLAHELNTPLSVLKGIVERIERDPQTGVAPDQAALMLRVVHRLERLSEGLLDFARVRPPESVPSSLPELVAESITLVRLDREPADVEIENRVPEGLVVVCDADRIMQVLVNLIRNAVDAVRDRGSEERAEPGRVVIEAESLRRDGAAWVSLTVTDNGPGIPPEVLPTVFEPFVTTRLDASGTGLGLAVAEGIVREHGGVMLVRNNPEEAGAVFEVLLPGRGGEASEQDRASSGEASTERGEHDEDVAP